MVLIEAEWALWSRRPDQRDDYAVLNCSGARLGPGHFQKIITRFDPGTPEAERALPRMTLSCFGTEQAPHIGIAIQTSSPATDGTGREIEPTQYFCVPYSQLREQPISYRGLYQALRDIRLPDAGNGPLIRVEVPRLDPEEIVNDLAELGIDTVRTAAALMLTKSRLICLVQTDQTTLDERLRFLDAVAALLPYGYHTKITATTWANSATRHKLRLSFARRANREATPLPWKGTAQVSWDQNFERDHFDLLDALFTQVEPAEIITRLATDNEPHGFDEPQYAIWALQRIGAAHQSVRKIHEGELDPHELRELFVADPPGVRRLSPATARAALARLIGLAEPADWPLIERWWPELAGDDPGALLTALLDSARRQLWSAESVRLRPHLVLADRHNTGDWFLAGLISPPPRRADDLESGLGAAVQLVHDHVIASGETAAHVQTLKALFDNSAVLCELIAQLAAGDAEWLGRGMTWLESTPPGKPSLLRPFQNLLSADPDQIERKMVEELAGHDRSCVRALLDLSCTVDRLHLVLPGYIDWLIGKGGFRPGEDLYWASRLAGLDPALPGLRGMLDVLLLVAGGRPTVMMVIPSEDWTAYRSGFVTAWRMPWPRASLPGPAMADHLREQRWQVRPGRAEDVLALTEELSTGSDPTTARLLTNALRHSFTTAADLSSAPRARTWLKEHRHDLPPTESTAPEPRAWSPLTYQATATEATPPAPRIRDDAGPRGEIEEILDHLTDLYRRGTTPTVGYRSLAAERRIRDPHTAVAVVRGLTDALIGHGATQQVADVWTATLAGQVSAGEFGAALATVFRREMLRNVTAGLRSQLTLLNAVTRDGSGTPPTIGRAHRAELERLQEEIRQLLKEPKPKKGRSSLRHETRLIWTKQDEREPPS